MVICLERGINDLHMVQLMPLPLHHLQIGLTSPLPAYPGCLGKEVSVCLSWYLIFKPKIWV